MKQKKLGSIISHIYLLILTFLAVFPLIWIMISSIKGKGELTGNPTAFLPKEITLEYFRHVIFDLGFIINIRNSIIIALVTTVIAIIISSLAAYGIVRFFPNIGNIMSKVLVTAYIFPPILLAIPYSIVMAKTGLVNTRIEEAAKIDGANKLQVYMQIVIPLVAPGVVATAIYTFINAWNEFLYALILINDTSKMTVAVALRSLNGSEILDWGDMMAASALVVIPSIIFFCLIQNKITGGLSEGAVK